MEHQTKRGKKDAPQIRIVIRIIKETVGDKFTLDEIDKAFCQSFIDYLLNEYKTIQGEQIAASTACNYYRVLNGAELRCGCGGMAIPDAGEGGRHRRARSAHP